MRVLVITKYLGNLGGLGRYSYEVVKAQRSDALDVDVLSEFSSTREEFEFNLLKPVFNQNKINFLINFVKNIITARKIARDYDIVHAHDGWPYGVYGWFAVIGTTKKLFITGIGTYSVAPLKEKIRGSLLRLAYKRAGQVFCISKYVLDQLVGTVPHVRAKIVLMGTTKLSKVSTSRTLELRKRFKIENNHPIVVTVGDIKNRKGQLDTLKSFSLLRDIYPNFLYVIIGDDADVYYLDLIKSYTKEFGLERNIMIIPKMYNDETLAFFYTVCDLVMLNSNNDGDHFEGFGLVLLEAAQFGKPVIGSRGCGIESAILDGYNGYLTNQGDPKDIAQKVKLILEKDYKTFGLNAIRFQQGFSWEETAKAYYSSYISST